MTKRRRPGWVADLPRDCLAGAIASLLQISNCFTFAALIFSGPWQPFLGTGVTMMLVTSTVTAAIAALTSSFRVAVAGPVSATSALLGAMLATLATATAGQSPSIALGSAYAALGAATVTAGAVLLALGTLRLGKAVRFVPYPVIAGFMGATGWIMVSGAARMATGLPLSLASVRAFAEPRTGLLLGLVIGFAALLALLTRRVQHALTLPLALIGATLAAHAGLHVAHVSLAAARAQGFLFEVAGRAPASIPWLSGTLHDVDWAAFPLVLSGIAAVTVVSVMQTLVTATGLELSLHADADLDRELRSHGIANIASALSGGTLGFVSSTYTAVNIDAGARGRASGLVVGLVTLAALLLGADVIGYIPRFALGGMLLMFGSRMLWDWGIAGRRRMALREWLLAVAVILLAATLGFLPALLTGVIGGCVLLAVSMSRLGIIRRCYGVNEGPSSLRRSEREMLCLAEQGGAAQVLELGGFIFFGSAYQLYERVRRLLEASAVEVLVFDFSAVSGIDASATAILGRIRALARKSGLRVIVSSLDAPCTRLLRDVLDPAVTRFGTIDEALESAEAIVLATRLPETPGAIDDRATEWLAAALGGTALAQALEAHLATAHYHRGEVLCRQGEATDTLLFIRSGRVAVMQETPGRPPARITVFGPHTVAGELAFFLGTPRTATLLIARDASVGALSRAAYRELSVRQPDLALALLNYLVRVQAERLVLVNNQVTALRR